MEIFLSLFLCASFVLCVPAQERSLSPRRAFQAVPALLTMTGTSDAAGVAQSPQGYVFSLPLAPTPQESLVGLYGQSLSGVSLVMLWHSEGIAAIPAQLAGSPFPSIEALVFRLPAGVTGEVWITTTACLSSNAVD